MKIVVCGDSFCTGVVGYPYHFSDLLNIDYGHEVINLALPGGSNTCIAFQIKKAIQITPDVIIYNKTDSRRVEVIMDPDWVGETGLSSFRYPYTGISSFGSQYVGDKFSPIFSTNLSDSEQLSTQQKNAVENYWKYLFDWSIKGEIDTWLYEYWNAQIVKAGIIPISVANGTTIGDPMYKFAAENPNTLCVFHTDKNTQKIISENIQKEIEKQRLTTQKNMLQ